MSKNISRSKPEKSGNYQQKIKVEYVDTDSLKNDENLFVEKLSPFTNTVPSSIEASFVEDSNCHYGSAKLIHDMGNQESWDEARTKLDEGVDYSSDHLDDEEGTMEHKPPLHMPFIEMVVKVMRKHNCLDCSSGMYPSDIIEALKEEFPAPLNDSHRYNSYRIRSALNAGYFHRTIDDRGKALWSLNEARYSNRRRFRRGTTWSTRGRGSGSLAKKFLLQSHSKTLDTEVEKISIAELTLSVFLVFPSMSGYSVNEVLNGVRLLYPMRSLRGLKEAISSELISNTCYDEVPSVCLVNLYRLSTDYEKENSGAHYRILTKFKQQPIARDLSSESLHTYSKRLVKSLDNRQIPEKCRSETELTAEQVAMGVLIVSPLGVEYSVGDVAKRAAILYPSNSVHSLKNYLSRALYSIREVEKTLRKDGTGGYRIGKEYQLRNEARRAFLIERVKELNLPDTMSNYLLNGSVRIKSDVSQWNRCRSAATKDLLDLNIVKHETAALPRFRKKSVSEQNGLKLA